MSCLLCPAMQKFYSAINSLEKFSKEKDFFENISSLDTFFSEFRNVTFVLQKSLAHTNYCSIYEKNRQKYLSNCRWFIDKRNETTKQQPFQLIKEVELTIFFPERSIQVSTMRFTVENDVEISTLIEQFKQLFTKINPIEVFFSAKFSFYEKDSNFEVYNKIMTGISQMKCFLKDMKSELKESCKFCDIIEQKMTKIFFLTSPRDVFFITDYVYYPQKGEFERAFRLAMMPAEHKSTLQRMSLKDFCNGIFKDIGHTIFEKFVMMHVIIGNSDLMPTIMIIYQDDTFELDTFHSDIKTTVYRKINEMANKIANEDVKEVFWMQTYLVYPAFDNMLNCSSKARAKLAEKEFLAFMRVDNTLSEEEIVFDGANIKCKDYIVKQLESSDKNKLNFGKSNMMPIISAFKRKLEVPPPTESV